MFLHDPIFQLTFNMINFDHLLSGIEHIFLTEFIAKSS